MRALLDTHALLWYLNDSPLLPETARHVISSTEYVETSIASLWEIAIKIALGKMEVDGASEPLTIRGIADDCRMSGIDIVPISVDALAGLEQLPDIHKDPFDRLIVAQATCEGLTIVTKDANIQRYDVETIWD